MLRNARNERGDHTDLDLYRHADTCSKRVRRKVKKMFKRKEERAWRRDAEER